MSGEHVAKQQRKGEVGANLDTESGVKVESTPPPLGHSGVPPVESKADETDARLDSEQSGGTGFRVLPIPTMNESGSVFEAAAAKGEDSTSVEQLKQCLGQACDIVQTITSQLDEKNLNKQLRHELRETKERLRKNERELNQFKAEASELKNANRVSLKRAQKKLEQSAANLLTETARCEKLKKEKRRLISRIEKDQHSKERLEELNSQLNVELVECRAVLTKSMETQLSVMKMNMRKSVSTAVSSDTSAIGSVSKSSDSSSKKRKLSEERSTDESTVGVRTAVLAQIKDHFVLGHPPYHKLLAAAECRSADTTTTTTSKTQFLSLSCEKLIRENSDLSLERILDPSLGKLKIEIIKPMPGKAADVQTLVSNLKGFVVENGVWDTSPKVRRRKGEKKWDNLVGGIVNVKPITDELIADGPIPHSSPLFAKKAVFAAQRLYAFNVLTEDIGKDYLSEEHEAIYSATRVETEREIHAFDKQIGTQNIVSDPLAFGETLCHFVHDFRKDPTHTTAADIERLNCQFVHAKVNGYPRVFLVCTKQMEAGTQLLADYGPDFGTVQRRHELYLKKCECNEGRWQQLVG